ncbi:GNAT family N-acetyltransferase [Shimia abyssi]|uniref:Acetyltransferase (GNAT) family protein n=1 Tax=Shimia abyssi TaxID=1662395 RepID=A0A2P8FG96_9RHOB|nr:GNAT family N-acetyltransferase [Shimia abyssi]PSL20730.1 acetyltransferase (GNAT) family protein [Shimia abyssi]
MSTALHLAGPDDLAPLLKLVTAFHAEMQIEQADETRQNAIYPLLDGSPYGVCYLAGPRRAPIGYVVVTFGWSVEFGGLDAFIDEIFIRPGVRRRGVGGDVLSALPKALASAGIRAFHLEVDKQDTDTQRLYARAGFERRDRYTLMTRRVS